MISCLCVTREGKLDDLAAAVRCFAYQSFTHRELVIVHDAGEAFHEGVEALARSHPEASVRVVRAGPGSSLGALRNVSMEHARGDVVCQWDDDDLNHPDRLAVQHDALVERAADACFFTDQLHYFRPTNEMYWDDWTRERFPLCLIQGTLMGFRARIPPYPDLARGEDTALLMELLERRARLAALQDRGYLYVYTFNGRNAWDAGHHGAISRWKAMDGDRLLAREHELRRHLADYGMEGVTVTMPYEGGALEVPLFAPPGRAVAGAGPARPEGRR